jgi:tetratricopeptide (TPR) repeat protein
MASPRVVNPAIQMGLLVRALIRKMSTANPLWGVPRIRHGVPRASWAIGGTATPTDFDAALHYFELALEKDSTYALGYYGIAAVWASRQQMGFTAPSGAAPRMRAAVARALELDDTLAEAHFALAAPLAWIDWNWAAADEEFRRAIDLNPNDGHARAFYSHCLHFMKRPDEAMTHVERAIELDPVNPLTQSLYGVALVRARRYDEAIVQCRNALETAPGSRVALDGLSFCALPDTALR